jgi:hypothetical protein
MSTDDNTHDTSGYWVLTGRQLLSGDGENARGQQDFQPANVSIIRAANIKSDLIERFVNHEWRPWFVCTSRRNPPHAT